MKPLSPQTLTHYRRQTFRLEPEQKLRDVTDALRFVNERGFVYFWPIKGFDLPNLWTAVAGDRPVADKHDDPGHITWGWKDQMLDKKQWYYAKILRGKATLISQDKVPYFYALSENYGDPDQDYLDLYEQGLLSREAKLVYETLLREGPLDTVNLRRIIQMTAKASNSPFDRALSQLQRDFKILPVGVAQAGAWRYSFIYDMVHRFYPDLPEQARSITRRAAREKLVLLYLASMGAATAVEITKLFQWPAADVSRALDGLVTAGEIEAGYTLDGRTGEQFIHKQFPH
jgi:hypothetical protein